jgi:acetyl esterase/lipase
MHFFGIVRKNSIDSTGGQIMEKIYYSEPIERDTHWRQDYIDTTDQWLQGLQQEAAAERADFMSPEAYAADPEHFRRQFVDMLGFPLNRPVPVPECTSTFVAADGDVDIYRMQFTFFDGLKFYGMYFKQRNIQNAPFVVSIHGGEGTPEVCSSLHNDSANYNHQTRRVTDRGCNVFAPQLFLWRVSKYGNPFDRGQINSRLRQLGGSVTALELALMRGCTDWFVANGEADPAKMGVIGLSYGGMYALFLAAADTRFCSCFSCSWFADRYVYAREDWSYRNALRMFGDAETAALVAPRRLVIAMGSHDELFRSRYTLAEGERLRPYYRAAGAENQLDVYEFFGLHEQDRSDRGLDFFLQPLES